MAGHSQFKNIMHRKGAQDKKRAKVFTKIIRELTTAARTGLPDPAANPRLRAAVLAARQANMPKDTVDRAIKRGAGGAEGEAYEEVRYEGYGPGGVAIIVEALTDNRNRTATNVRVAFSRNGGNLGASGSVSHGFDRLGLVEFPATAGDDDKVFEAAIEAGADDVESDEDGHRIWTSIDNLHGVARALEAALGERLLAVGMDDAVGDMAQPVAGYVDDAPAGVTKAGIESEEAHAGVSLRVPGGDQALRRAMTSSDTSKLA